MLIPYNKLKVTDLGITYMLQGTKNAWLMVLLYEFVMSLNYYPLKVFIYCAYNVRSISEYMEILYGSDQV